MTDLELATDKLSELLGRLKCVEWEREEILMEVEWVRELIVKLLKEKKV